MKGLAAAGARHMLKEYMRRIDVEAVLDYYGAENGFWIGDEYQHSCLLDRVEPHHSNGDQNPSARANVSKKTYVCYSWGGGSILWLIAKMEGKESVAEVVPMLGQFLGEATLDKNTFLEELESYFASPAAEPDPPIYSDRVLRRWELIHPYLYEERGVSPEAVQRLRVGWDPEENRIIFPHWCRVGGEVQLVGWQKRSLTSPNYPMTPPDRHGQVPKYKNSTQLPKADTVYNLERVRARGAKRILVVESPMSVLKAETFADPTDPADILSATVSTFGAKVGERQMQLLAEFPEVLVWMDDDDPGRHAAQQVTSTLYRQTSVLHIEPDKGMDMADYCSRDDIMAVVGRAEPAVMALGRWRI